MVPLWPSEESMHRWSPHCALGWLQAELEEAEQEAEVRGGAAAPGDRAGDPNYHHRPPSFLHGRVESPSSRKPTWSAWPRGEPRYTAVRIGRQGSFSPPVTVSV